MTSDALGGHLSGYLGAEQEVDANVGTMAFLEAQNEQRNAAQLQAKPIETVTQTPSEKPKKSKVNCAEEKESRDKKSWGSKLKHDKNDKEPTDKKPKPSKGHSEEEKAKRDKKGQKDKGRG